MFPAIEIICALAQWNALLSHYRDNVKGDAEREGRTTVDRARRA